MKRHGHLFERVVSSQNLFQACKQAARGKKNKVYVGDFLLNLEQNIFQIKSELENDNYVWSEYYNFIVYEPKKRTISAPVFRDRVVHYAICNIIEPIFDKIFIESNFACRKGKGTLAGVNLYEKIIYSHPELIYVLKCDVQKYFFSVEHNRLFTLIQKKIKDRRLLNLLHSLIFTGEGKGIPIGNLTSQLFANIYLNQLDHVMKEELKIKYYLRYMDDFMILHENKRFLREIRRKIKSFLSDELFLTLHPNKQHILKIDKGVAWLGYRVFRDYRRLKTGNVVRFRRSLKRLEQLCERGSVDVQDSKALIASWFGLSKHADAFSLSKNIFVERDIQNLGKYFLCRMTQLEALNPEELGPK